MKRFELSIELKGVEPRCFRKVTIQSGITFENLHRIIQVCMGWKNSHSFEFRISGFSPIVGFLDDLLYEKGLLASNCIVEDYIGKSLNTEFTYTYDFGDYWVHQINVSEVIHEGGKIAFLSEAEGACPPEDIGGSSGYHELLQILSSRNSEKIEGNLLWMKLQDYVAEDTYNKTKINNQLSEITMNMRYHPIILH